MSSISESSHLRLMTDEDLPLVREWRNSPAVRENMYTAHEISEAEHLAWWAKTKDASDKLYLVYEAAAEPLGVVSFYDINRRNNTAFWAFYASPDAKRRTGSQMEMHALDHAFLELKLHKLCCEVLSFNSRVIKLHQKFGFSVEGIFREQFLRDDQRYDIFRLGILATEWLDRRDEMQNRLRIAPEGK